MNPARIPTQAEHDAMQRLNAAYYATQQASRFDLRQRTPIFTCAPETACANDDSHLSWPVMIAATLAGMGMWAAAGYAFWWGVGLFFAQGVK